MANTRLEIGTESNVGFFNDLPVTLINQIADVAKPDKRVSTGSLTINIPLSKENNILFENIFEANISLQTFNPHLKTSARYLVNELTVFKGYAQLLKINVDERTGFGDYEISLVGELLNIYTDIQGRYLTDLDFSAYDHDLTYAQISGSWGALGSGFTYPCINWGTNNSNLSFFRPIDFRACYFVREYLDKIFTDAGYTWTSSFLDGSFFSHLIIPPTKAPVLDPSAVLDGKFLAVANGTQTYTLGTGAFPDVFGTPLNFLNYANQALNTVNFPTETYDQNNIFNNATYVFTVPNTTKYNLSAKLALNFVVKRDPGSGFVDVSANMTGYASGIHIILYNVTTSTQVATYDLSVINCSFANGNSNNCSVNLQNVSLTAGDTYKVYIKFNNFTLQYTAATAGASWKVEVTVLTGSNFSAEYVSDSVFEGASIPGNSLIPVGIKQSDFLTGIIKMFNLYLMVDRDNPRNYIIEPRPDFYLTTPEDWTDKHDYNSNTEIKPLAELDFKDYRLSYKTDGDYFNKLYSDYYKNNDGSAQVYGTHEGSVTNDFLNNLNTTEIIFSPTPYNANSSSELVVPAILKNENNTISEFNSNIRILYYSGSITKVGLTWNFVYNNGANTVTYNQYPHAGHTDNPYAPTLDLNFGLPVKTYYTYPNLQWTTNNLYNAYYSQYINQVTDKNSRMVVTDFYLTPADVNRFDFRKPIFYIDKFNNGAYYLVNKFTYNPLEEQTTRVELIKLANYDPFEPDTYDNGGGNDEDNSWNKVKGDNIVTGPNNYSDSYSSAVKGGSGNFIANSSINCTLIDCENCTVVGAENFTAINATNMVFDYKYSNTTFNGADVSETITNDTDIDRSYNGKTIYINASSNDVTITWDPYNMNDVKVDFIRIDSSTTYTVYIDSTTTYGTENFIGNAMPYDLASEGFIQYAALPLTSKTDTIYIKK